MRARLHEQGNGKVNFVTGFQNTSDSIDHIIEISAPAPGDGAARQLRKTVQ
jgi:hypothetical protein